MSTVGFGKAFPKEYVAQMAATVHTLDLRSLTIDVGDRVRGSGAE